ncbi:MAG: 30S ribosome-binding factor RbfA [Coxiellaceae bacterium]|jgi:ribosome-binding factor A|nr:30S ribosome-binding factor RbfA [Coxiellaceae bacterium]
MSDGRRKRRIEEYIQRELGFILLKNPRQSLFTKITITAVKIATDLSIAKVFFSVFYETDINKAKEALQSDAKFLRKMLAYNANLRLTPRLIFIYDESINRGRHLVSLIDVAIARDINSSS